MTCRLCVRVLFAVVAAAFCFPPFVAAQAPDAIVLMRQAMGGESALSAIQTLTIEGSSGGVGLEHRFAWPDRYARITRQYIDTPMGNQSMIQAHGIAGGNLIGWIESDFGANLPPYPDLVPGAPASAWQKHIDEERMAMTRRSLLLFGADSHSAAAVNESRDVTVDGRAMHVVELAVAGQTMKLTIDAGTNLPVSLSWMGDAPSRTFVTTDSMVTTRGGQVVSQRSLGEPTVLNSRPASQQVEWVTSVDQFKADKGITWPRRLVTTAAGKKSSEEKVTKYIVNPTFPKEAFRLR